jgi:hypothetical protein
MADRIDETSGSPASSGVVSRQALDRVRGARRDLRSAAEALREAVNLAPRDDWYQVVRQRLVDLGVVLAAHIEDIEGAEGVYADLLVQAPWQEAETEILEGEHQAIRDTLDVTLEALEAAREENLEDPSPVRRRVETLLERLDLHCQREMELVYEVYDTDIGPID